MQDFYEVKPIAQPVRCEITVPGSKSITNRALLLAAMANGGSVLSNVLFSDDSRSLMDCLDKLGYVLTINEPERAVSVQGGRPGEKAAVNVRSAGTSARFLTAMLAAYPGEYEIDASAQMKARPMKPLFDALVSLGCTVAYGERDGYLPVTLHGGYLTGGEVALDAGMSSQFLSALLMTGCLHENDLIIRAAGRENARSYVDITLKMMADFGVRAERADDGAYIVRAEQTYHARPYAIEPDVSGACYFYAAAALTGGSALVKGVHFNAMQGDINFLYVLEQMGCHLRESAAGICLTGPEAGGLVGVDADLGDCSDQTMTLAAIAPFASSPTTIRNIGHIRYQESNRITAIVTELTRMGVSCEETENGLVIYPGTPAASTVETYGDHRMAMAFALTGLRAEGIKILNPACTHKTFEQYFETFGQLYDGV